MIVDGLVNYWPMFNGVYDLRGKGDPISQVSTSLTVNKYGVTNGAIFISRGYVTLPDIAYLSPSFTLSFFSK